MNPQGYKHCIIAVLIALLWTGTLLGQEIPIDIVTRVNAVDYIFEGKVIKSTPYRTSNSKYIYTSNTIQITKILKGDLSCGTVELITDGGMVDGRGVDPSHSLKLRKDCAGIFLAKGTAKELSPVDFYDESNYQKVEATFQDQSFIKYWHDGIEWRVSDVWANFDSLAQVYNLAELITGLHFVDCEAPTIVGGGWGPETSPSGPEQAILRPDLDIIRQRLAEITAKKLQIQMEAQGGGGLGEVTYGLTNLDITGTDPLYLEFDININDDMGTKYLYYAGARVVYDTLVFGSNIGQTSNMDVINAGLISDLNCYGYSYPNDLTANSYVAFAFPAYGSQCLAMVPTTPVPVFHIRMKILDCLASTITLADSAFLDGPSAVLYYSAWSETAEVGDAFDYATANIDQTEEIEACGPMITSFSPSTVAGGIQQVLEIHGSGFGATRGTGTVFFKNANDGGGSEVACDAADFLPGGWSDDLIRLYVPSSDLAIVDGTAIPDSPAGTGPFRVVTDTGVSIPSVDTLSIFYSVASFDGESPKLPALLGPLSVFEGRYVFNIDSLVASYEGGAMVLVIKKALREWTCLTGVDWLVADDPAYQSLPGAEDDSLCVINFGDLGGGILALTTRYPATCAGHFYTLEADVVISSDPDIVWFLDTVPGNPIPAGQTDFYHTVLHELGHAHNLKHVLAPEHIMYFADNTSGAFRKIALFADASAYEGGNWVMDESYLSPPAIGCELSPISISTSPLCAGFYAIDEHSTSSDIQLQPNPFSRTLRVSSLGNRIRAVQIFNALGAMVARSVEQPCMSTVLDLTELVNGLYMVNVVFDNATSVTVKVVKEN